MKCNDINPEAIVAAKESALASVPDKYIKEKEMVKMQIDDKNIPEMDMKYIQGGFARLYFDMDLWLYKLVTFKNGIESIQEILSPSKAINAFKELK
tara:strand:+ start:8418 stop:8705 length:288 start_codon:yes stop_codon:yes gene_type:complete